MTPLVYDPARARPPLTIVCFISGSGTNYREIAAADPTPRYLVFTNRPGCDGTAIARENGHEVIELNQEPYLKEAIRRYGPGKVPRNCPERVQYEQELCRRIEARAGGQPDLLCLAGYDQWVTDWMVDRYYPRLLNVHPGDTTKGYDGLYWIPSARAILAGDAAVRSTLFFVDKGEDTGPVLVQSAPLDIAAALRESGDPALPPALRDIKAFAAARRIKTYADFRQNAPPELRAMMEKVGTCVQAALKVAGDWRIYPFGVHQLIARGRVAVDGRTVYIDGREMPAHGYRLEAGSA